MCGVLKVLRVLMLCRFHVANIFYHSRMTPYHHHHSNLTKGTTASLSPPPGEWTHAQVGVGSALWDHHERCFIAQSGIAEQEHKPNSGHMTTVCVRNPGACVLTWANMSRESFLKSFKYIERKFTDKETTQIAAPLNISAIFFLACNSQALWRKHSSRRYVLFHWSIRLHVFFLGFIIKKKCVFIECMKIP